MLRILLVVIALLTGGAATLDGQDRGEPDCCVDPGPVGLLLRVRGELSLTDDQVARLERIDADLHRVNEPLIGRMKAIRADIGALGSIDDLQGDRRELFETYIGDARSVMEKIRKNNWDAMKRVGEVLTASQKETLSKLLRELGENRERSGDNTRVPGG